MRPRRGPLAALSRAFHRQAFTVQLVIPGVEYTREAPKRSVPAPMPAAPVSAQDPLTGEAQVLTAKLDALQTRMEDKSLPTMADRPGLSRHFARVARVVPLLRPKPMHKLTPTATAGSGRRPAPPAPATTAQMSSELLAQLNQLEADRAGAAYDLQAAIDLHAQQRARHGPTSPTHQSAEADVKAAHDALNAHTAKLQAALQVEASERLAARARADQVEAVAADFTHSEVARFRAQAQALHDQAQEHVQEVAAQAECLVAKAERLVAEAQHLIAQAELPPGPNTSSTAQAASLATEAAQHLELQIAIAEAQGQPPDDIAELQDRKAAADAQAAYWQREMAAEIYPPIEPAAGPEAGVRKAARALEHALQTHASLARTLKQAESSRGLGAREASGPSAALQRSLQTISSLHDEFDALAKLSGETRLRLNAASHAQDRADAAQRVSAPRARKARDAHAASQTAITQVEARQLQTLAAHPPGFPPEHSNALRTPLQQAVARLPQNPAGDALPPLAVMQIAIAALSEVTGGDAERAAVLLDVLGQHTTLEVAAQAKSDGVNHSTDLKPFFHLMSQVPRGMEVLSLLGANGSRVLPAPELLALRTYWRASAEQATATPNDQAWLEGAKRMAGHTLWPAEDEAPCELDRAAANAVRNGMYSREPGSRYDVVNERLNKAVTIWTDRGIHGTWGVNPQQRKTPFHPTTLKFGQRLAATFGLTTAQVLADKQVRLAVDLLQRGNKTPPDAHAGAPDMTQLAAQALLDQLHGTMQGSTDHVSLLGLQKKDLQAVRRRVEQQLSLHPRTSRLQRLHLRARSDTGVTQVLKDLAPPDSTALQVLQHIAQALRSHAGTVTPELDAAEKHLAQAHQHSVVANASEATSRQDLYDRLEPMLDHMRQGQRLTLRQGGELGVGLPRLPYVPPMPVSATAQLHYRNRQEAQFEMFMSAISLQISVGTTATHAGAAGAEIGPRFKLGPVAAWGTGGGIGSGTRADIEAVNLRLQLKRGFEAETRQSAKDILWEMMHWTDASGTPQRPDLLSALLSKHDNLSVQDVADSNAVTGGLEFRLQGNATVGPNRQFSIGPQLGLAVGAERMLEKRNDLGGYYRVVDSQASTATQKLRLNAGVVQRSSLPYGLSLQDGAHGRLAAPPFPLAGSVTRTLWQQSDRMHVYPREVDGKFDADHDRIFNRAGPALAELTQNRDAWVARGLEVMPHIPAALKDTVGRQQSEKQIDQLIADIKHLEKTSEFASYTMTYSIRPQAQARIDVANALGFLAGRTGDGEALSRHAQLRDQVMNQPASWRPLHFILKEKGQESLSLGLNFGLRDQRVYTAEAHGVPNRFPTLPTGLPGDPMAVDAVANGS